jgi:Txe/YoeB family toxin of Txe-Axe toxin-antitoxin module
MKVANVSEFRKNLKAYINHIADNSDTLIKDCLRNQFKGLGKPEPLKGT